MHLIMAGNPGVGKSFLLNSLSGAILFPSGVSLIDGKTTHFCTRTCSKGITYSDTPGLDDINSRERAANEISKALRQGGTFKLVFVAALEDGRVRPADVATIHVVLRAIEPVLSNHDMTAKFSVIVNKCGPRVMQLMDVLDNREVIRAMFSESKRVEHMGFLPRREDAFDQDDVLVECPDDLRTFIDDAPEISIPIKSNLNVRTDDFQEECDRFRKELEEIEERIKNLDNQPGFVRRVLVNLVPSFIFGAGGYVLRGLGAMRLVPAAGGLLSRAATAISNVIRWT